MFKDDPFRDPGLLQRTLAEQAKDLASLAAAFSRRRCRQARRTLTPCGRPLIERYQQLFMPPGLAATGDRPAQAGAAFLRYQQAMRAVRAARRMRLRSNAGRAARRRRSRRRDPTRRPSRRCANCIRSGSIAAKPPTRRPRIARNSPRPRPSFSRHSLNCARDSPRHDAPCARSGPRRRGDGRVLPPHDARGAAARNPRRARRGLLAAPRGAAARQDGAVALRADGAARGTRAARHLLRARESPLHDGPAAGPLADPGTARARARCLSRRLGLSRRRRTRIIRSTTT